MNLSNELQQFDGKHVEPLKTLAARLLTRDGSVDDLIAMSGSDDANVQIAATWILKWLSEQQVSFSQRQTEELLRWLGEANHWETKLHLLQMLGGLQIPSQNGTGLRQVLQEQMCSENKLVRAWAYNGIFVLADQHSRFRIKARELLSEAQHDTAASVRARVRNVCKASGWAAADQ